MGGPEHRAVYLTASASSCSSAFVRNMQRDSPVASHHRVMSGSKHDCDGGDLAGNHRFALMARLSDGTCPIGLLPATFDAEYVAGAVARFLLSSVYFGETEMAVRFRPSYTLD